MTARASVLGIAALTAAISAGLPVLARAEGLCSFDAYADASQDTALHIHAAPSADSLVVGQVPNGIPGTDTQDMGAEFAVLAVQSGWARVTSVTDPDYQVAGPDGWIDAALINFSAQTEVVFAEPDATSQVVWRGEAWPYALGLLDCTGKWARISFEIYDDQAPETARPAIAEGWVRGICASQRTTCDGTWGDWAKDHAPAP